MDNNSINVASQPRQQTNKSTADTEHPHKCRFKPTTFWIDRREQPSVSPDVTPMPHWSSMSISGLSHSQCDHRKFYALLAAWIIVLGVAVAAGLHQSPLNDSEATTVPIARTAFAQPTDTNTTNNQPLRITLLHEVGQSMPTQFVGTQPNVITHPEWLLPAFRILAQGERPLRILQIGDSHVAGRTFPQSLRTTLESYFGDGSAPDATTGIQFNYIARNGATNQHFLSETYQSQIAAYRPDLIIISLGTNEAHGMGYREDIHTAQLNTFFQRLRTNCPNAIYLLTTPPGDYLTTSYIQYRTTSHSNKRKRHVNYAKRPNPMSARCANCINLFAADNQMAVWDLYNICGGPSAAMRNWATRGYMRPDRIHFQPQGYTLQGQLLGQAIARAAQSLQ